MREKTSSSLTIAWDTDELADSFVEYGTTEALGEVAGSAQDVRDHAITLTDLEPGSQYFFNVQSTDPSDNGATISAVAIVSTAVELDLTPPSFVVEPSVTARTDDELVVEWRTDEAAAARVEYETPEGDQLSRQLRTRNTVQQVILTNLETDTEYLLQIFTNDASQNEDPEPFLLRARTEGEPDLEPPRFVDAPKAVNITDRAAIIRWTTDELADSYVDFDRTPYLGVVTGSPSDVEEHMVVLTRLEPGTDYFYRVGSTDRADNGPTVSGVLGFTTEMGRDLTAPAAPEGLVVFPGSGENLLEWTSNDEADLGGYTVYREENTAFVPIATQIQEPRFRDQGLVNGQLYRYQVSAVDQQPSPNESPRTEIASGAPDLANVPKAPAILGLEQGATAGRPILVIENAEAVDMGEELTYTVQLSSTSSFRNIVDRGGNISEGFGLTRWRVNRNLVSSRLYWWRGRATDGRFAGPWSESVRLRPRQATTPALTSRDFNGDGTVSFADFFIFASGFGSTDANLDLDRDGRVGKGDLSLLKGSFGETAAQKLLFAQKVEVAEGSHMDVTAEAFGGRQVVVQLRLKGVPQLLGYGLGLRADPPILRYQGRVDSVAHLGGPQVALELDQILGDLFIFAEHLRGRQRGVEVDEMMGVDLLFEMTGAPRNVELELYEAYISKGTGRAWSVAELSAARVLPSSYALFPNYPNPFNPSTTIPLAIPPGMAAPASLVLYNILGQTVRTWQLAQREAGFYNVTWDGRDDAGRSSGSGVYLVRLDTPGFEQTQKLLLVR